MAAFHPRELRTWPCLDLRVESPGSESQVACPIQVHLQGLGVEWGK